MKTDLTRGQRLPSSGSRWPPAPKIRDPPPHFQAPFTLLTHMENPHSKAMPKLPSLLFSVHYRTATTVQTHFPLPRHPAPELGLEGCPSPAATLQQITASFPRAVFQARKIAPEIA